MNLTDLRKQIDGIDQKILELLANRTDLSKKVLQYKKKHNLSVFQPSREKEILAARKELAAELNLDPKFVDSLFEMLFANSRKIQEEALQKTEMTEVDFKKLKLRRKKLDLKLSIWEIFKSVYANADNFFFLESLGEKSDLSRYSYIGFDPVQTYKARGQSLFVNNERVKCENPLQKLKELVPLNFLKAAGFHGGLLGYLSYESLRYTEDLPYYKDNDEFYDFEFGLYLDGLIYDKKTETLEYFYLQEDRSQKFYEILETKVDLVPLQSEFVKKSLSDEEFKDKVKTIKDHIQAGDVYQTVLANRYQFEVEGSTLPFYEKLRQMNPSPFMFFIKFGRRQVIGSSPELVTKVTDGKIQTFPIAGTRKRGKDKSEDEKLAQELLADIKERSEHMMLVDMGRNDLGRVCEFDSVRVDKLMTIQKYSHVQHIVSYISGKLRKNVHLFDAVMANMPMGTVCGAPRLEAIKLLNQLEPVVRGPYSGAAGYFSFNNECMMTLMIRSLFVNGHKAYAQAGAGVVYDSVPEYELKEVEKKLRCVNEGIGNKF